uniref:B(0,+)-type amino acid transporter 1 n=1 Tax=Eptatretus burgeri TaxID=7764 RepID=A0A8C4WTM6_EPTBU
MAGQNMMQDNIVQLSAYPATSSSQEGHQLLPMEQRGHGTGEEEGMEEEEQEVFENGQHNIQDEGKETNISGRPELQLITGLKQRNIVKEERSGREGDDWKWKRQEENEWNNNSVLRLKPRFGFFTGVSIIVGNIFGSGIFISPGGVLYFCQSNVGVALLVWTASGLLSMIGSLCYAELGCALPSSGGEYTYLRRAFGRLLAFFFAWISVFLQNPASNAVQALTFAEYALQPFYGGGCAVPGAVLKCIAIAIVLLMSIINGLSVKWAINTLNTLTMVKLIAFCIITVIGLVFMVSGKPGFLVLGFNGPVPNASQLGEAFYQCLWAYSGWSSISYMTEELKHREKNLLRCIVVSLILITVIYLLVNMSYLTVVTPKEIISDAVGITWGDRVLGSWSSLIPITVSISILGSLSSSYMVVARLTYGAAGCAMDGPLAMLNIRHHTPLPAIVLSAVLSVVFILLTSMRNLVATLGFISWFFVGLTCAALLVLRWREKSLIRPYKLDAVETKAFKIIGISRDEADSMGLSLSHRRQVSSLSSTTSFLVLYPLLFLCFVHTTPPSPTKILQAHMVHHQTSF